MRTCLFFLTLFISVTYMSCQYQDGKVPKVVKENFNAKYPNENDPDWDIDKNDNFEASFKKDGVHYRADFSPNGNWIETENNIDKKDLPEVIQDIIDTKYEAYKIVEIEEVTHYQKGFFYDVEITKDGNKQDVEFLKSGAIIN
ncbi:PepSY-like domain-containing protein [Cellulophaga sp. E16_2]|uniref:Putative beta-lactamase-inhibitor-like PepSY-like domain-containing protein n=1 Tax=Cellulophaga algicola (strain DSM 14237 / IC166 / ACAM 630) TaxID=688270 RepID=E6X513_CELAD|nr:MULTISPECIES: PepSY-like domain-containing protein [Cellulophaga]ADV48324.1 hypothetical protein Celal_0999 [Cellulophaga algicola DSM 14237]MBO0590745.1 PepSY-like domain-containing protein [Cellulophaga sp. E16_2]